MIRFRSHAFPSLVVPRKGDVDRNILFLQNGIAALCRPPQGGRG